MTTLWSYLAYTRPLTLPVTFILVATGYGLAVPAGTSMAEQATRLFLLFLLYSVFGWGGANAINSAEDKDTGPVNLLPHPPPLPRHLKAFGVGWSALGLPIVVVLGPAAALITAAMFALSLFYSLHRRGGRRGKDIAGVDAAINATGSGFLTILLGASAAGDLDVDAVVWAVVFTIALLAGYPTTQIFQSGGGGEHHNVTARLGARRALELGAVGLVVHAIAVVAVADVHGGRAVVVGAGVALVVVAAVGALRWSRRPQDAPYARMTRQMTTMLTSQALIAVGLWGAR